MKHTFYFFIVLGLVLLCAVPASAQVLVEDFTGSAGNLLTAAGWTAHSGAGTNAITITSPGLTYTGYPESGVGNAATLTTSGEDDNRTFTPITTGSAYAAFMVKVTSAQGGDYFFHLGPSPIGSSYFGRVYVRLANNSKLAFGLTKGAANTSEAISYSDSVYSTGTTYLLVLKYGINATTTTDDSVSLFIYTGSAVPATEPATPTIGPKYSTNVDVVGGIGAVALRQGTATTASALVVDGIRVANSWATATQIIDTVNVTFLVNTATIPDTLWPTSTVQLRGSMPGFTWDYTSVLMSSIGGDYWKVKVPFTIKRGDTLSGQFKIFTNAKSTITSAQEDLGWENNTTDATSNRVFSFGPANGTKDTVLLLEYANGSPSNQPQYWRPYVPAKDSVAVMFRVNMQSLEGFNPTTTKLGVRGAFPPNYDWGTTIFLQQEANHGNSGSQQYVGTNFWSTVIKIPKTYAAGDIGYKFVQLAATDVTGSSPTWEDNNRSFPFVPTMADTTLHWKWWNDVILLPFSGQDTVIMTFRADLANAVAQNGFAYTDTLVVRSGYISSAVALREKRMYRVGISSKFAATDTVITKSSTPLYYQYYREPFSGEVREIYYNFNNTGQSAASEKRRFMVPASANKTAQLVQDTINSVSAEHRMPLFQNMMSLGHNMVVTYTCDVRPAIYQLKKGGFALVSTNITNYTIKSPDSVLICGVWMDGPAVGGWDVGGGWGPDRRLIDTVKMWDNGTHGDVKAGDSIFTLTYSYTPTSLAPYTIGQVFKFGIYGCDNEGGYGNNHIENINNANATATVASQFGSIDPVTYSAWDYTNDRAATGVSSAVEIPLAYRIDQNYPNPFNPSTKIGYQIASAGVVTLKVFNVLGQLVTTLVNEKQEAGQHLVTFDAAKLSSGLYFYQITSGKFVATKKMILMK